MSKIRATLDTNIIVSALKTKEGNCFKIVEKFKQNHFLLIYNANLKKEYDDKLNSLLRDGELPDASAVSNLINYISSAGLAARIPVRACLSDIPNDPKDIHLVELCFLGNINYVVTEDKKTYKKLNEMFAYRGIQAVCAQEFIDILKQ